MDLSVDFAGWFVVVDSRRYDRLLSRMETKSIFNSRRSWRMVNCNWNSSVWTVHDRNGIVFALSRSIRIPTMILEVTYGNNDMHAKR